MRPHRGESYGRPLGRLVLNPILAPLYDWGGAFLPLLLFAKRTDKWKAYAAMEKKKSGN